MKAKVLYGIAACCLIGSLVGLWISEEGQTQGVRVYSDQDWNFWSNPPDMYTFPNGNVGIGTESPNAKLDVYVDDGVAIYAKSEDMQGGSGMKYGGRFYAVNNGTGEIFGVRIFI